ncbi:MAG: hypothetical protein FJX29_06275 [Alphaproteobacteria bacterium]|nr:hypothetical protein [Alphaproteobacteria bacterium]
MHCKLLFFTCLALAVFLAAANPNPARAQTAPVDAAGLAAALPGLKLTTAKDQQGWLTINTMREPQIALAPFGFRLRLEWNGLDDRDWPFARIAAAAASKYCGTVRMQTIETLIERLYKTRSLIPQRDLGGNAGRSFMHRSNSALGQCRIELFASGARWHLLSATVYTDEGPQQ